MRAGLQKTAEVLAHTRNRAVLPLLLAGIRSSRPEIRAAILRAAIQRHDAATHTLVVRHFAELDEADQAALCDAHRAMPHHATPVLRKAVLAGDATLCGNACDIILSSGDFDLFPTLLKAAEDKKHRHLAVVLATIAGLADLLYDELARWAGGIRDGSHDPSFVRHQVLAALERSLARFAQHRRAEILDAFLLLAPVENTTFLKFLREPRHPCHEPTVEDLSTSEDSGIMERLVDLLRDTESPTAALEIIARRTDQQFLNILLHELKHPVPLRVLHNMQRLTRVDWLETHRELLLELAGRAQAVAVELAMASEISRESQFELLALLLRGGLAEGRRASCQALAKFDHGRADELVLACLDDPDAGVQAAALRQLRPRKLPDALKRLVASLDAPSVEVRDAARSSLAEFNFVRYRAMFDLLDEQAVRTTGMLVHKVDFSVRQKLVEDLTSPSLTSRLRGIEMAVAMAATDDVESQLIELARHENVAVRKEAVAALGHCMGAAGLEVLEMATRDPNRTVADAARQSLAHHPHNGEPSLAQQASAVEHSR